MNIFKKRLGLLKDKKSDAKKLGDAFSEIAEKVGTEGYETPQSLALMLKKDPIIEQYYLKNTKTSKKFSIAGAFITAFINKLNTINFKYGQIFVRDYEYLCELFLVDSIERNRNNKVNSMVKGFKEIDTGNVTAGIKNSNVRGAIFNYFDKISENYKNVDDEDKKTFGEGKINADASNIGKKLKNSHFTLVRSVLTYKEACDGIVELLNAIKAKWLDYKNPREKVLRRTESMPDLTGEAKLKDKVLRRTWSTSNLTELSKLNDDIKIDFNKLREESGKSPLTQDASDEKPVTPSEHGDKLPEKSSTSKKSKGRRKFISKFNVIKRTKNGSDKSKHDSDSSEKISKNSKKRYDNSSVQPGRAVCAGHEEYEEKYKSVQDRLTRKRSKSKEKQLDDNSTDSSK